MTLDTALLWLLAAVLTIAIVYLAVAFVVLRMFWGQWKRAASDIRQRSEDVRREVQARDHAFTRRFTPRNPAR